MPPLNHPALIALAAVLQDAAERSETRVHDIGVELVEARVWPDRGFGLPGLHGRALTSGYLVRLTDGTTYRTDQTGRFAREEQGDEPDGHVPTPPSPDTEIRLRYTEEGGVGGWRTSFETSSEQLTPDEEAELRRLITEADFFSVPDAAPGGPVVLDGITRRLWIAVGRRAHEVVRGDGIEMEDTEAFGALVAWAAERTPPLVPVRSQELT